jgi:glutamine amidotransferase
MSRVGIIDTGICNLGSLVGALESLGFDPEPVRDPAAIEGCNRLLLPGVGAFAHAMTRIQAAGLDRPIRQGMAAGKPLLGICLGMQLLFEHGEEGEVRAGLGLLPGRVRRMREEVAAPLPHVGWNELLPGQAHPLLDGIKPGVDFYFTHSFCAETAPGIVVAAAEYGELFPAIVARGNVVGVQFHPEKSQRNGLRLLENFCLWDGSC